MIMSKPQIVILSDYGHINGGAVKVALSSAIALAQCGYEVTVFCAVGPLDASLKHPNLRVICTGQQEIRSNPRRIRAALQGFWNRDAVKALSSLLDELDPDNSIIHAHGWTSALSSAALHKAIARNFKIVITLHDYSVACPNGAFFDYRKQEICHRSPLSMACCLTNCDRTSYSQKLWRIGRNYIQRDISQVPGRVRHFISISDLSEDILRSFLPANSTIHRVPNPIDRTFVPATNAEQNRGFLFVGRITPEKGVLSLARAAHSVGATLTFVGDGAWRKQVASCNPDAHFTGWLPAEGVKRQMEQARALVFPSTWYETQGLVVLEAAALGVSCIVSDITAAREMVVDGVTGLWFRGGEEQDLAAKLRILQDTNTVRRLGAEAYNKYWADPFTMDRHIAALERCYQQIVSS